MILVTGATGNVGSELVHALAKAGEGVRALVRNPEDAVLPAGVEAASGDLNKPESLAGALTGVRAVFLLPGFQDMPGLLAQARQAGVERVVLLSGGSAGSGDMSNAVTRYMVVSETAVRESGLAWTMLRPSAFMTNALRWVAQIRSGDQVRVPIAGVATASLDPFDLAAVAAQALLTDDHQGQILQPTGPQALRPADQIAVLARVLGRDLHCVALTDDQARAAMSATTPVEYVDAFFDFYVKGTLDESIVRPTVRDITGRPPRTFEQWAAAHAEAFR
jgi:uncharacterized protein YbjT (DUF2867 family)